eukprot:COSAG06_NODE_49572_length_324_cov_1.151111_2_plen_67_part_01
MPVLCIAKNKTLILDKTGSGQESKLVLMVRLSRIRRPERDTACAVECRAQTALHETARYTAWRRYVS